MKAVPAGEMRARQRRRVIRSMRRSSVNALLRLAARADQLFRGPKAKLTVDRAAYFSHHNWVVEPKRACPPGLWKPEIDTLHGLRETADWYRAQGWL